ADVLALIARGKTTREIAAALFLSPGTVRKHLEHLFKKLGLATRAEAATSAIKACLPAASRDDIAPPGLYGTHRQRIGRSRSPRDRQEQQRDRDRALGRPADRHTRIGVFPTCAAPALLDRYPSEAGTSRKEPTVTTIEITRRDLLRRGAGAAAVGGVALALPGLASADVSHGSEQIGEIYELQAAFHRAKTTQDPDLMISLWADDATFTNTSTGIVYVGTDEIRRFWLGSGSFRNHRFSLVPSYKTTIDVRGDQAFLYFECHDVGNFATGA